MGAKIINARAVDPAKSAALIRFLDICALLIEVAVEPIATEEGIVRKRYERTCRRLSSRLSPDRPGSLKPRS
jgi:hypothetical protein